MCFHSSIPQIHSHSVRTHTYGVQWGVLFGAVMVAKLNDQCWPCCCFCSKHTTTTTAATLLTPPPLQLITWWSEVQPKHKLLLLLPNTVSTVTNHFAWKVTTRQGHWLLYECTCFTPVRQTNMIPPTLAKHNLKKDFATLLLCILYNQEVIIQAMEFYLLM